MTLSKLNFGDSVFHVSTGWWWWWRCTRSRCAPLHPQTRCATTTWTTEDISEEGQAGRQELHLEMVPNCQRGRGDRGDTTPPPPPPLTKTPRCARCRKQGEENLKLFKMIRCEMKKIPSHLNAPGVPTLPARPLRRRTPRRRRRHRQRGGHRSRSPPSFFCCCYFQRHLNAIELQQGGLRLRLCLAVCL